jgi:hypothetical protein
LFLHPLHILRWLLLLIAVGLGSGYSAYSQQKKPQGTFLADTLVTGKPFRYAFSYLHDTRQEVFFPDTTFDFSPFELVDQEYFTTRTEPGGSLDSTIYRLVAFDVAALQVLRLPVYVLNGRDCTAVYADADTIPLRLSLPATTRPDTLRLLSETRVDVLRRQFNYPVFVAVLVSVALASLVIYWLFGRGIMRQWNLFQLQRRHRDFVRTFARLSRNAQERESISEAEKAVIIWKKYLERMDRKPFATYTTREIVDNFPDEFLEEALKNMDRIIYGQVKSKQMDASLQVLKNVAQRVYRRRRLEIASVRSTTSQA